MEIGLSDQQLLDLSAAIDAQASGVLVLVTFPMIPLGYLLLGIAGILASRHGAVPRCAGWVLALSVPLVLVGGATILPLFGLGWVAVTVGVAGIAAAWARRPAMS